MDIRSIKGVRSAARITFTYLFGKTARVVGVLVAAVLFAWGCNRGGGGGGGDSSPPPVAVAAVTGTLSLPGRVTLDSDTPDPANPQISNNTRGAAQDIADLAYVAGYVDSATDVADYFSVEMNAGEKIYLEIADGSTADLDLYLYQGSTLKESSATANQVESVTVPADGAYLILVTAVTNGSIYNLVVGLSPTGAGAGPSWSEEDDFVAGDVVVKFNDSALAGVFPAGSGVAGWAALSGARLGQARAMAGRFAADRGGSLQGLDPRGLALLDFPDLKPTRKTGPDSADALRAARRETLTMIREISNAPEVEYAEPNFIAHPTVTPDDIHYGLQWDMDQISMPAAWDSDTGDPSIIIAVVDTGVLYDHPDLAANILKDGDTVVGYDMISDPDISLDGDGADPDPYDVGDKNNPDGTSTFHGTHVSGTASAATNNNMGVAGVGWKVKIMPVRVLGHGGGTYYDVAEGIYYAAGLDNAYHVFPKIGDTVTPAHIINMSLGASYSDNTVKNAVAAARAAGVIIVAAAGNDHTSAAFYPAAYPGVVGVSAVDYAGKLAPYSNYGTYVDIAAPGGNMDVDLNHDGYGDGILSTLGDDRSGSIVMAYAFYEGTSMAAPHIAGVAALMKHVFEEASPPGVVFSPLYLDALINGTTPGDTIGSITDYAKGYRESKLGYGLIDAQKALAAAYALATSPEAGTPHLGLEPNNLDFGFSATSMPTQITNSGINPLSGVTVDSSYKAGAAWLSHKITGATLTFTVKRDGLTNGAYSASVTVNSTNGGSAVASIVMYKGVTLISDMGIVYVILVDPATGNISYQTTTSRSKGYKYTLAGVTPGNYLLAAGTDLDNDTRLGDNGEAVGSYPYLGAPVILDVTPGVLSGKNFSLEFVGLPVPGP